MNDPRAHADATGPARATAPGRMATPIPSERHRLTLRGAIHGELLKMLSIPSSVVSLIAIIPLCTGLMWLFIADKAPLLTQDPQANLDLGLDGAGSAIPLAILLVIIVAVLNITAEYANGQIGVTNSIVPRRGMTVIAKAVAVATVTWVVGFVSLAIGGAVAVVVLTNLGAVLPDAVMGGGGSIAGRVLSVAAGGATGLAAVALIALCIGGVLRSTPFAIAAAFGLILVLPGLMALAPVRWISDLTWILPEAASRPLYQASAERSVLEGGIVLAATVLIGLGTWSLAIARR